MSVFLVSTVILIFPTNVLSFTSPYPTNAIHYGFSLANHNKTFYLLTVFDDKVEILTSENLEDWSNAINLLSERPQWAEYLRNVHLSITSNGEILLYMQGFNGVVGVAKSNSFLEPFQISTAPLLDPRGTLVYMYEYSSIFCDNGRFILHYQQTVSSHERPIKGQFLAADGLSFGADNSQEIILRDKNIGAILKYFKIFKRGKWYYIIYGVEWQKHLFIARSTELFGPYNSQGENPFLCRVKTEVNYPIICDVFENALGEISLLYGMEGSQKVLGSMSTLTLEWGLDGWPTSDDGDCIQAKGQTKTSSAPSRTNMVSKDYLTEIHGMRINESLHEIKALKDGIKEIHEKFDAEKKLKEKTKEHHNFHLIVLGSGLLVLFSCICILGFFTWWNQQMKEKHKPASFVLFKNKTLE